MNKLTKATIAASVGIALLLGGAGTFATWNSSSTISGGTISAGTMTIGTPVQSGTTPFWTVAHLVSGGNTYGTPTSLTLSPAGAFTVGNSGVGFVASPGDKLSYTASVPLTVNGTNLSATLALATGAISASNTATPADVALAKALVQDSVVSMTTSANIIASTSGSTAYTITGAGAAPVYTTLTATIIFPSTAPTTTATGVIPAGTYLDNAWQLGSVTFAGWGVTLQQTS